MHLFFPSDYSFSLLLPPTPLPALQPAGHAKKPAVISASAQSAGHASAAGNAAAERPTANPPATPADVPQLPAPAGRAILYTMSVDARAAEINVQAYAIPALTAAVHVHTDVRQLPAPAGRAILPRPAVARTKTAAATLPAIPGISAGWIIRSASRRFANHAALSTKSAATAIPAMPVLSAGTAQAPERAITALSRQLPRQR